MVRIEKSISFALLNEKGPFDIAKDLIIIKNLASMKEKLKKADVDDISNKISKQIYCSALNILSDKEYTVSDDSFKTLMDDFSKKAKGGTPGSKVRNFLINNIINSRRFYYIIKYYDARKCYKLIQNEELVRFVLERDDMPFDILSKYYKTIVCTNIVPDKKVVVNTLIKSLKEVSLNKLINKGGMLVKIGNDPENNELVSLKSLIGLYLLVCYWLVKGVVNVNSVYLLAWSAFERDYWYLYNVDIDNKNNPWKEYLKATKEFNDNKKCYAERHRYLKYDIAETETKLNYRVFREYRNKIVHYDVVLKLTDYLDGIKNVKSYFDIYNYSIQKFFSKENEELRNTLNEFHCYNKNYLKLINMPFAYNMARYKNLTIADLFNDNYPKERIGKEEDSK